MLTTAISQSSNLISQSRQLIAQSRKARAGVKHPIETTEIETTEQVIRDSQRLIQSGHKHATTRW